MYTGVVLDNESRKKLKGIFPIPLDWCVKAHHMTINMGAAKDGPAADLIGQTVELKVVSVAQDDLVLAVGVECTTPSNNKQKHITLAVNEIIGGKAVMSNNLTEWKNIKPFTLKGQVLEIS